MTVENNTGSSAYSYETNQITTSGTIQSGDTLWIYGPDYPGVPYFHNNMIIRTDVPKADEPIQPERTLRDKGYIDGRFYDVCIMYDGKLHQTRFAGTLRVIDTGCELAFSMGRIIFLYDEVLDSDTVNGVDILVVDGEYCDNELVIVPTMRSSW